MANSDTGGGPAATVTCVTATAIVVADMVGVGVFTSLGFQVKDITSGFSLMLLWIIGGVVAMCGAVCYAELASMFPRSSGEYNFLRRIYHPAFGFMAGWLSATVGFAAPVALAARAFSAYFKSFVPNPPPLPPALDHLWLVLPGNADPWLVLPGLGLIWLVSLVHLTGIRRGSTFQNAWTALKLLLIVVFVVAGFAFASPQPISFSPSALDTTFVTGAPFAISLVFVMYSYSGWNAATYIIGEIRDPQVSLPRALFIGTAIVTVLYVALNAVFLVSAPLAELSGQIEVAMIAGSHVFGELGGRFVGMLICLGLVSSVSAMVWIGPRVTMTMGEDMPMLRFFARKSRKDVPARAIVLQLLVATLLMTTGTFDEVLDFIQFSLTFCTFFTVLGVIWLRFADPEKPRPYRAWGYPVTPLVFLAVTAFMMYYLVVDRPLQSLASLAVMLAGLAIYATSIAFTTVPAPAADTSQTAA
jgi:APA family basic amino acid/polyamine antiporter